MRYLGKRSRLGTTVVLAALIALFAMLSGAAATSATAATGQSPVVARSDSGMARSVVSGTTSDGRMVRGTFTPSSFEVVDGGLNATGTLEGRILGHGQPQSFNQTLTTPVKAINGVAIPASGDASAMKSALASAATSGGCGILHLDLGPLDLNLLGLQVHLNEVVLDITAHPGPGNLLGNLLCDVAGLLDQGGLSGLLSNLTDLLNQILGGLNL